MKQYCVLAMLFAWSFSGCLQSETRSFRIEERPDGSATAIVIFHNIVCDGENDEDYMADYRELVDSFVIDNRELMVQLNQDLQVGEPEIIRTPKLFEENGLLSGKVVLRYSSFRDLVHKEADGRFYMQIHHGDIMSSNGKYSESDRDEKRIYWADGTDVLEFELWQGTDRHHHSLLPEYLRVK